MFESFTDAARHAIRATKLEAVLHGDGVLRPEHLLLALIRPQGRPVPAVLGHLGISASRLRQTLDDLIGSGLDENALTPAQLDDVRRRMGEEQHFDVEARQVLEQALRESLRLRHTFIGPQHLLLGIAHAPATIAAQVLAQFGAGLAELRSEVSALPVPFHRRIPWRWRTLVLRRQRRSGRGR